MFHENDCDNQLILTDIVFCDVISHIIHSTESLHDCKNETNIMIKLKYERQA